MDHYFYLNELKILQKNKIKLNKKKWKCVQTKLQIFHF